MCATERKRLELCTKKVDRNGSVMAERVSGEACTKIGERQRGACVSIALLYTSLDAYRFHTQFAPQIPPPAQNQMHFHEETRCACVSPQHSPAASLIEFAPTWRSDGVLQ